MSLSLSLKPLSSLDSTSVGMMDLLRVVLYLHFRVILTLLQVIYTHSNVNTD